MESMEHFAAFEAETDIGDKYTNQHMPALVMYGLGLAEEAGEVAGKLKKVYRDNNGVFTDEIKLAIVLELGDCLWYLTRIAVRLGFSLARVALENTLKLRSRRARGVTAGSGDHR